MRTSPVMSDAHQMEKRGAQLGHQRPRCHAAGREDHHFDRGLWSIAAAAAALGGQSGSVGQLCLYQCGGRRCRYSGRRHTQDLRAFFYHQTLRPGYGTWSGNDLWGSPNKWVETSDLETELGVGTTVRLFFPCAQPAHRLKRRQRRLRCIQ